MSEWKYTEIDGHKIGVRPFFSYPEKSAIEIDGKPYGIVDTDKVDMEVRLCLQSISASWN